MGFIPQITCRHCGKKFSAIHNRCPHCGTRRVKQSTRAASSTNSVRKGTGANARAAVNTKWQFIFGCILVALVILAVIILIAASTKGTGTEGKTKKGAETPAPTETVAPTPSPTPTPVPTPTPTPTPTVTSVTVTFLGRALTEFTLRSNQPVQLGATVYPVDVQADVKWSSSDESIMTVSEDGLCTFVSPGVAYVYAECGIIKQQVKVYVAY